LAAKISRKDFETQVNDLQRKQKKQKDELIGFWKSKTRWDEKDFGKCIGISLVSASYGSILLWRRELRRRVSN
jgi:hypothetical protein